MNPIVKAALGSMIRHALTGAAMYLVAEGIWTQAEAETYVAAGTLLVLGLGWALWQKFATHHTILDALDLPRGSSLEDLKKP